MNEGIIPYAGAFAIVLLVLAAEALHPRWPRRGSLTPPQLAMIGFLAFVVVKIGLEAYEDQRTPREPPPRGESTLAPGSQAWLCREFHAACR
jgi:hypothetical protein